MGNGRCSFFRAVPPDGERPSPHQETEAGTSARNTTRSYSNIVRRYTSRKFRRLTPPANAGSSRRQTALGGGRSIPLSLLGRRKLSSLFKEQTALRPGETPMFSGRLKAAPKDALLPSGSFASPVEKNTNENEFQCQLNFSKKFHVSDFFCALLYNILLLFIFSYLYHMVYPARTKKSMIKTARFRAGKACRGTYRRASCLRRQPSSR